MTVERCPMCAEWIYWKGHKCKPVWLVAIVEGEEQPQDDDYSKIRASDEEEAAKKAAEEDDSNSAEYSILKHYDGMYVAWVKAAADAKPKRFKVTGEAVPQYYAEEIEE
jgi:hypothetical protein